MRRFLAACVAVLLLPLPALGVEEPCPDLSRPFHLMPFCFSETELQVYVASQTQTEAPRPQYVAGVEQWRSMVAYYWPSQHVDRMLRIMRCESGGNPYADNPRSSAAGLFQIMGFWQKAWPGDYFDPWTNAAVAYQIWLSQGFGAWVCRG